MYDLFLGGGGGEWAEHYCCCCEVVGYRGVWGCGVMMNDDDEELCGFLLGSCQKLVRVGRRPPSDGLMATLVRRR